MMVDDHWYDELMKFKWYFHKGYAIHKIRVPGETNKWESIRAHRYIKGVTDPDILVDHRDGNKLNNTEDNLRVATKAQNNRNVKKTWTSSSKYKGVTYQEGSNKPWIAQIGYENKRVYLGAYHHEKEAAQIYNLAAKELYGEFAELNDMEE